MPARAINTSAPARQVQTIPAALVDVGSSTGPGYSPVLSFSGFTVAMLRHSDAGRQLPSRVERHPQSDEVFILTAGWATLVVCDGEGRPRRPFVTVMQLNVAYNVRAGVWHTVVMSTDAHIVLIERDGTPAATEYHDLKHGLGDSVRSALGYDDHTSG